MSKQAWESLDLHGGGLQSLNLLLAKKMKKHSVAYALWFLFPLGLHRAYLNSTLFTFIYLALSAIAVTAFVVIGPLGFIFSLPLVMLAMFDLFWIDRRITALNKELRKQIYLQRMEGPPEDFRGRYPQEEAEDQGPDHTHRILTFNEQEALLKEMSKRRKKTDED